ncbi:MAG TPA: FGGY family carbohydrate kinase [Dehalococcoidia bacterium]|nr:FGGY family carbohydrate kinase [Dehalococcoidia bacterium]
MSDFVLALDQGTSSSRAILFDHSGQAVASSQREFRQIYPQPGWVEHDAEEIWESQAQVARDVLSEAGSGAANVAAIGITNQRETTVIWDRDGKPVANAIVWQDRRTAPICEALRSAGREPEFRERTGLLLDPYFSGTKVKWLLDNVPDARARAERAELMFGTIDSWLLYQLCGIHSTDYTNASRTLLYNIFDRRWDEDLLAQLDVPASLLPAVKPSSGIFGETELLLGAPHWDPHARGGIFGLTRGANRAHVVRATLESIAYQTRDVVEAMQAEAGITLSELRVDGGAAANNLLLQFQADILGCEVVRPAVLETTALGAAYLAGLATGFWKDRSDVAGNWREDRRFTPQMDTGRREELYAGWRRAVERTKNWSAG